MVKLRFNSITCSQKVFWDKSERKKEKKKEWDELMSHYNCWLSHDSWLGLIQRHSFTVSHGVSDSDRTVDSFWFHVKMHVSISVCTFIFYLINFLTPVGLLQFLCLAATPQKIVCECECVLYTKRSLTRGYIFHHYIYRVDYQTMKTPNGNKPIDD